MFRNNVVGNMKIMNQKLGLIFIISVFFLGCVSNYTPSDYLMVYWENENNIYSFDKAESIAANFIASNHIGFEPEVIFNGIKYKARKISSMNNNGSICKYNVIINSLLKSGEYELIVNNTNGKDTESAKTTLIVYPSRLSINKDEETGDNISDEESIMSYLQSLSKEDILEYNCTPSSGLTIPYNQFRILLEGFNKSQPILGNQVRYNYNYYVPIEADSCGIKLIWTNPIDQKIQVQLFPSNSNSAYIFKPKIKSPRLVSRSATRITNSKEPTFEISCDIKAPYFSNGKSGFITDVKFTLIENNLKDYKIVPLGDPYSQDNNTWFQKYILQGKLPLTTPINGDIKCKVSARTTFDGDTSNTAMLSNKFSIHY